MSSRQCYYPNGDLSKSDPPDIPCNDDDGAPCCPDKWECQSNGLCYYQPDDYYGRYTCTDQSWESDGCPRICTYDLTASGNEALLDCNQNSWCCDTNRPSPGCCDTTTDRFSLDSSKREIPIGGSVPSASASLDDSVFSSAPSETDETSTTTVSQIFLDPSAEFSTSTFYYSSSLDSPDSDSSITPIPLTSSVTTSPIRSSAVTSATIVSDTNGEPSTVIIISAVTALPAATDPSFPPPSTSSSDKNLAIIVAPAVVVPLVVLAALLAAFLLLRRRRRRQRNTASDSNFGGPNGINAVSMYKTNEVSPTTAYTHSELEGSSPDLTSLAHRSIDGQMRYSGKPSGVRGSMLREGRLSELGDTGRGPAELPAAGNERSEGLGIRGHG